MENKPFIYLDNAATTPIRSEALEAMMPYLSHAFANPSSSHSFGYEAKRAINNARETIAEIIGAEPCEVYFTSGGTEANNTALCIGAAASDKKRIITSSAEHKSVLKTVESLGEKGRDCVYLTPESSAAISIRALEEKLADDTALVSLMQVNNETGALSPIKELCAKAKNVGALFHTDSIQAVGHIPINVKELGIDMLSSSAHKFGGPKGVGFLYIKKGTPVTPLIFGGGQEMGVRAGTENVAAIVGMSRALKIATSNMNEELIHQEKLEKTFLSMLNKEKVAYTLNGGEERRCGIISISFEKENAERIMNRLDLMGIYISTGAACDSRKFEVSHVLRSIGKEKAHGTVRISLGTETTESDVKTAALAISKIVNDNHIHTHN